MTGHRQKLDTPIQDMGDCAYAHRDGREQSQSALSLPYGRPSHIAGPSRSFVSLTRNPDLAPPRRFEPTVKQPGDLVL